MISEENLIKQIEFKQRKKPINSQHKGKAGEYYFANFLSEVSCMKYMKVPASGGILGASNQQKILQLTSGVANILLGDLIPPSNLKFKQILECKNFAEKSFSFSKLKKTKTNAKIELWLEQLLHDCLTSLMCDDKRPILPFLLIKITGVGSWICYNKNYVSLLFDNKIELDCEYEIKKDVPLLLQQLCFGDAFYMTDFKSFIIKNKNLLFETI
jgi:hypothetical protein